MCRSSRYRPCGTLVFTVLIPGSDEVGYDCSALRARVVRIRVAAGMNSPFLIPISQKQDNRPPSGLRPREDSAFASRNSPQRGLKPTTDFQARYGMTEVTPRYESFAKTGFFRSETAPLPGRFMVTVFPRRFDPVSCTSLQSEILHF